MPTAPTSIEAPEGIVVYSFSGNGPITIPAGAITVGKNAYIDPSDYLGDKYPGTEYTQLTDTNIETIDLVSEGIIDGPLSGRWVLSGNLGQIGYSSASFSGYATPAGFENLGWLRSIYWNQLPILSDAGQFNFQNTDIAYTLGSPNGDILQTLTNEETTSRTIGLRLYAGDENAQVFRILNINCKGAIVNIKFPALSQTLSANGDIMRAFVRYLIQYRPIFSTPGISSNFTPGANEFIFGKIAAAGGYINSSRIDFNLTSFTNANGTQFNDIGGFLNDPNFVGWEIRISKSSVESTSALYENETFIDSITELYGSELSYPNSAMFRSTFDSRFFSAIPERAFECNFLKVKIPANYDPIMRTYTTGGYGTTNGYWNGTFATGKFWTNNPAWCFYDLITNTRYGLGKYVNNIDVYKYDLYNIAQYCDELVADGYGGVEPRFTCNVWIAQKEEAYKVVNDMASIFRGLVYYFNGNLNATQDAPKSSRVTFTNANVENGDFSYSSTSKKTRQSIAVVRYNDPKNYYLPAIEYVDNLDSIRRYGIRELPIVAFGCTSRGQAIRLGRWALFSNNIETETITFTAGLETNLLRCGDLFEVFDANRKGKRYGGRVTYINNINSGANIVLDSTVDLQSGVQYNMSILTPSFYYDPSQVTGLTSNDYSNIYRSYIQTFNFSGNSIYQSGTNTVVVLPTGLDAVNYNITGNPVWSIQLGPNSQNYSGEIYFSSKETELYRVLDVKEADENKYQVVGLYYWPEKFGQVDSGLVFQQSNLQQVVNHPSVATPYSLNLSVSQIAAVTPNINYSFLVDNKTNIDRYIVNISTGNKPITTVSLPQSITQSSYSAVHGSGIYTFIIQSFNATYGIYSSGFASGSINTNTNFEITNTLISSLSIL